MLKLIKNKQLIPPPIMLCRCMCHTDQNVKHCVPCCTTCPICGLHIKQGFTEHMQWHKETEKVFLTTTEG